MTTLLHAAVAFAGNRFLPGGAAGRLSILVFHSIVVAPDVWRSGSISRDDFARLMAFLSRRFCVVSLEEGLRRLADGTLQSRSVAVTFDDGYLDNVDIALPVLLEHGLTATFFIATGALGGLMWNDRVIEALRHCARERLDLSALGLGALDLSDEAARVRAYRYCIRELKYLAAHERTERVERLVEASGVDSSPGSVMMTRADVARLASAGMTIGAHTVTHPILARLELREAECEMRDSRDELAALTGQDIALFAYPNGRPARDYDAAHVALARRVGFRAAVTTSPGVAVAATDLYQLPRFTPPTTDPIRFGLELALNGRRTPTVVAAS
jgi:peptidoglycan/xylan/chitin deacetylase (PgdA/CDA1 family)